MLPPPWSAFKSTTGVATGWLVKFTFEFGTMPILDSYVASVHGAETAAVLSASSEPGVVSAFTSTDTSGIAAPPVINLAWRPNIHRCACMDKSVLEPSPAV